MTTAPNSRTFERIAQRIDPDSVLMRAWPLTGGVSALVTALTLRHANGGSSTVVVRQHGARDLARNPQIAADEFRLLEIVRSMGVSAPTPYLLDQSGEILPSPYLVVAYIDGAPQLAPPNLDTYLEQIVTELAAIHRIDDAQTDLAFLPQQHDVYSSLLDRRSDSSGADEQRVRAALQRVWPLSPRHRTTLLHGDFWPGNLLWKDDRLVAVIDWEDAARGDPLADLANCRLELLLALDDDAMDQFTRRYVALTGIDTTDLPYWDLCVTLRPLANMGGWGLDAATESRLRAGMTLFIDQALDTLADRSTPGRVSP